MFIDGLKTVSSSCTKILFIEKHLWVCDECFISTGLDIRSSLDQLKVDEFYIDQQYIDHLCLPGRNYLLFLFYKWKLLIITKKQLQIVIEALPS